MASWSVVATDVEREYHDEDEVGEMKRRDKAKDAVKSVLISELHEQTAATHCESTCSLARRRNIMLHREDEGTRRPLMHVHIRYWLRLSIRIASVPLLNANRKKLRYGSFGKSCTYPVIRVLSAVENLRLTLAPPKTKSQSSTSYYTFSESNYHFVRLNYRFSVSSLRDQASSGRGPDSPLSSDLALDKPRSIPSPR
ncbi:hypothetical protein ALC57_03701 [Trachymyrmex cornetzi]|uniref:Uncharacterized protein n=1 Tax=Trachymyrmex cornetzi TaxID=471704 RepID=A0A151JM17_9HYME|nr:hypothetical protein ALC57_03701 [Trachymyrmex cornetzi]